MDAELAASMTVRVLDKDGDKIAYYSEAQKDFPVELRNALRAFQGKHPETHFIDVEFEQSD